MELLAIIPARGGSKGLPRKNVRLCAGKPLLAWTIEAARASGSLDRVIVSTEDQEIREVAQRYGAEVPFMRPAELVTDTVQTLDVVLHAVHWLEVQERYEPDVVLLLQPTSPLRTDQDIEAAVRLAIRTEADAVVSVCEPTQHPYWMKRMSADGRLRNFLPVGQRDLRRQALPSAYAVNGAIYLIRRSALLVQRTWYPERTYAYVMPPERSIDIDTLLDFEMAEFLLQRQALQVTEP